MHNPGVCLAFAEGLGQVYDCGSCGNIHLQIGPVNLTLDPKAYTLLAAMIAKSATNLEAWLLEKKDPQLLDDLSAANCPQLKPARTLIN